MDRKRFFKDYLLDLLEGIDTAFDEELSSFAARFPELVRPPGACPEKEFLEKCRRCGACIKACPHFALKPVTMSNEFDLGTPALRSGEAWCRFCEAFPCIEACQSGALSIKNSDRLHKIGIAGIKPGNCLRSSGEPCRACIDKCPANPVAVVIPETGHAAVIAPEKCSGCGACLTVCPAYPDPAVILRPL